MTDLKSHLSNIKDTNGNNAYDHLANVFSKIMLDNPKNSYDIFEEYSHQVKQQAYHFLNIIFNPRHKYDFKKHDDFVDNTLRIRENFTESSEQNEKQRKLLDKLMEGEEEPQEVASIGYVPNFSEEAKLFEWAGVGFGEEESFRIFKALKQLSWKKQAKNVRLWGKILTSGKDYYVAEGSADAGEEEVPEGIEKKGEKGINKLNYWVSTDLLGEWTELPLVSASQLITSRRLKYIFTGDLEAQVVTNPHFDGKEKHLLKCQIARITSTTTIEPRTLHKVNEDEKREIETAMEDEGWKYPTFDALTKLENWVHLNENILTEGKVDHTVIVPENPPEDFDEDKFKAQIIANDPFDDRLKQLNKDKAPKGYKTSWTIKQFGDATNYGLPQREAGSQNYGVVVIKNLVWPGQLTVYNAQRWLSMYIGYGFKNSQELYFPQEPEQIQVEQSNMTEAPEPNFPPVQENQEQVDNPDDN